VKIVKKIKKNRKKSNNARKTTEKPRDMVCVRTADGKCKKSKGKLRIAVFKGHSHTLCAINTIEVDIDFLANIKICFYRPKRKKRKTKSSRYKQYEAN
jgi:hypothetical protein